MCAWGGGIVVGKPVPPIDRDSELAWLSTQAMCSPSVILQNQVVPACQALSKMFNSTWLPIALGLSNMQSGQPSTTMPCLRMICSSKFLYIIQFASPFEIAPGLLFSDLLNYQHREGHTQFVVYQCH